MWATVSAACGAADAVDAGGVSAAVRSESPRTEQALGSMSGVGVARLGEITSVAPHATRSRALAPTTAGTSPR